ncbi:MAG: hypothetical protein KAR45_00805 [Desulfobacteraceae bacterium]|nr:hypothetical protein [Desulfobacteraceae bacterium]
MILVLTRVFQSMLILIFLLIPNINLADSSSYLNINEAKQKLRYIQKASSEFKAIANLQLPQGALKNASNRNKKLYKKFKKQFQKLADAYHKEALRLQKKIKNAKFQKNHNFKFELYHKLKTDTTALTQALQEAVNDNRSDAKEDTTALTKELQELTQKSQQTPIMFSKMMSKMHETNQGVIRNI